MKKVHKKGDNGDTVRMDAYLAGHGIAARRNIDEILKNHVVTINGKRVKASGERFEKNDIVLFDGKKLEPTKMVYIMLHKPKDVLSTAFDEFGRKTVLSLVSQKQRVYPVGRLDQDTTGLILLTNDGDLANHITHPRYHVPKTYELTIRGKATKEQLKKFQHGVLLEDGMTAKAEVTIVKEEDTLTILHVVLYEGRKRQIRRMCEHLKMPLISLKRIGLGSLSLGNLAEGKYRYLTIDEEKALKSQAFARSI